MIDVFILGYNGVDYFTKWHIGTKFSDDIRFHFVDNGNQTLTDHASNMLIHKTTNNIFCSGGWNIICDIGFDYMGLSKIVIGQEDSKFDESAIRGIYENTNEDTICSAYGSGFELSLFGLHSKTFSKVGRFDENFLIVGDEDNDYKHRCNLSNIKIKTIPCSNVHNISITGTIREPYREGNGKYLHSKWGSHSELKTRMYEYDLPFNGEKTSYMRDDYRNHFNLPEGTETYMSEVEYNLFKQSRNNNE